MNNEKRKTKNEGETIDEVRIRMGVQIKLRTYKRLSILQSKSQEQQRTKNKEQRTKNKEQRTKNKEQ